MCDDTCLDRESSLEAMMHHLTYLLECRVSYLLCSPFGTYVFCLKTSKHFYIRGTLLLVKWLIILEFIYTFVRVYSFGSKTFKHYLELDSSGGTLPLIFKVPWLLPSLVVTWFLTSFIPCLSIFMLYVFFFQFNNYVLFMILFCFLNQFHSLLL